MWLYSTGCGSTQPQLRLQNGRFDAPDRLFNSMQEAWESVNTSSTDVKVKSSCVEIREKGGCKMAGLCFSNVCFKSYILGVGRVWFRAGKMDKGGQHLYT